jgi:hypothetical protein
MENQAIDAAANVASDAKAAATGASGEIATGQTSIALPKAGDKISRLASWAVTDPNQLNPAFFSFKDISCVLKSEGKPKVLLDMVSGYCKVSDGRSSGWCIRQSLTENPTSSAAR